MKRTAAAQPWSFVVSCEHASNIVPKKYMSFFARRQGLLRTHKGIDTGAAELAQPVARALRVPLFSGKITRLLVDLNRSIDNPTLFGPMVPESAHADLLKNYYWPHRQRVTQHINDLLAQGQRVLHLGIHSFTPLRLGQVRRAGLGILYDNRRPHERNIAHLWRAILEEHAPTRLRIRLNYPYSGASDGFTTSLRQQFAAPKYCGIELEVNQKFTRQTPELWQNKINWIVESVMQLREVLAKQNK